MDDVESLYFLFCCHNWPNYLILSANVSCSHSYVENLIIYTYTLGQILFCQESCNLLLWGHFLFAIHLLFIILFVHICRKGLHFMGCEFEFAIHGWSKITTRWIIAMVILMCGIVTNITKKSASNILSPRLKAYWCVVPFAHVNSWPQRLF